MDQQWCDIKGTLNKIHPGCIKKSPPSGSDPDSPLIMLLTRHMGLFHSHSQLCLYEVLYSFLICLRSLLVLQTALCSFFKVSTCWLAPRPHGERSRHTPFCWAPRGSKAMPSEWMKIRLWAIIFMEVIWEMKSNGYNLDEGWKEWSEEGKKGETSGCDLVKDISWGLIQRLFCWQYVFFFPLSQSKNSMQKMKLDYQ